MNHLHQRHRLGLLYCKRWWTLLVPVYTADVQTMRLKGMPGQQLLCVQIEDVDFISTRGDQVSGLDTNPVNSCGAVGEALSRHRRCLQIKAPNRLPSNSKQIASIDFQRLHHVRKVDKTRRTASSLPVLRDCVPN